MGAFGVFNASIGRPWQHSGDPGERKESPEEVKTDISPIDENLDEAKREKEFEYQSHTGASYFTKFVSTDPNFSIPEHDGFEFPQKKCKKDDLIK